MVFVMADEVLSQAEVENLITAMESQAARTAAAQAEAGVRGPGRPAARIREKVAGNFLPLIAKELLAREVEIRGDEGTRKLVSAAKPATEADYGAEYLAPIISVKVVPSLTAAIEHINRYGSRHTDAIVTRDQQAAGTFTAQVDSSAVLVNASTRFNDGFQLGLGAEIGISTDKFHARGPCGLKELTTYKYVVWGEGQVRE